jgi:hypothetical protein
MHNLCSKREELDAYIESMRSEATDDLKYYYDILKQFVNNIKSPFCNDSEEEYLEYIKPFTNIIFHNTAKYKTNFVGKSMIDHPIISLIMRPLLNISIRS